MIDDIITGIKLLFQPGQLVEIRGKRLDGTIFSKFFTDHDCMARVLAELDDSGEFEALWYTLQELKTDVNYENKMTLRLATDRDDIRQYNWLVIDIDRPKGDPHKTLNATDAELEALARVRDKVAEFLTSKGFPIPIIACSGNGWHLLYRLPDLLPSDHWLIQDILSGIAHHFGDISGDFRDGKICQIDTSLSEPEQIIKSYGTTSRKSPQDGGDRPWRKSYIYFAPDRIASVTRGPLFLVAAELPTASSKTSEGEFPVCCERWLEEYGVEHLCKWGEPFITLTEVYEKNNETHFVVTPCLGHSGEDLHEHTGKDAERHSEIILYADGGIGFSCWSGDLTIGEVVAKLEALKGEKYPHRIFEQEPFDPSLIEGFAEQADDDLDELNCAGTLAFATLEEAKASGVEFNNKGRLCRVCGERTVIGAMDTKCAECKTDDVFQPEEGKFEMARANDKGVVRQIVGIDASTVKPKPLEWLWHHKIPANAITWYYGAQGSAKSASTVELAATVSAGHDFPDGAKNEIGPRRVLMYNAEDDIERTVIPRLMAAGADLKMITLFDEKSFRSYENGEVVKRSIDLTKDLPIIATMLGKYNDVALIICDPITGIWGGKDINRDREVVGVLERLKVLCEKKKVTFIGVSHTNKRADVSALEKVLGSSSITGKCRSAWMFSQDPDSDSPHNHVMVWAKGNLSGDRKGMKFSTVGVEMEFEGKKELYPKIVWKETTDTTADDVLIKKREKREGKGDKRDKAKEWLRIVLSGGPSRSPKVYDFLEEKGMSKDTSKRAIREMIENGELCKPRQKNDGWWMALSKHKLELWGEPEIQEQPVMADVDVL